MFSTVLIHRDPDRGRTLRALAADTGQLVILREYSSSLNDYELNRMLNTLEPDIVIIDVSGNREALDLAARIRDLSAHTTSHTAMIAFGCTAGLAVAAQHAGFSSVLSDWAQTPELCAAIDEAIHEHQGGRESHLFCFLPSKAGSGASTVVLNTAAAMQSEFGRRVLVIDADLRSGILAFLLNASTDRSVQQLLASSQEIDQYRWHNCLHQAHGIDFLLSSRSLDSTPPHWNDYFRLLNFATSRYDAILVDLPELVNPGTVELVCRSQMVFPVCTPETPSLRLTGQRCAELLRWRVPEDRIGVLLNRYHRQDATLPEIEKIISRSIMKTFPNDYPSVRDAVTAGAPVPHNSRLGQAYSEFASRLLGLEPSAASLTGKLRGLLGFAPA